MPWNPSGCPLPAPEELRRERSPAWSHSWDGPRSLFPPTQGALNLSQGMQGWGLEMEKCLAKEPTLELMALTFISPYAVLLQHLQMSQSLRVTGTHPIKMDLLEWVFFSLPLDFFFFLAEEEELMEKRDCSISSEKWQKKSAGTPQPTSSWCWMWAQSKL